jgi:hypothetical protein
MKIKSEKQSSNVHEPGAEGGSSPLPCDPEKYRKYLAETAWSEKVQDESLETLRNMMSGSCFGHRLCSDRFRNGDALQSGQLMRDALASDA